jgi:hypothetical protein
LLRVSQLSCNGANCEFNEPQDPLAPPRTSADPVLACSGANCPKAYKPSVFSLMSADLVDACTGPNCKPPATDNATLAAALGDGDGNEIETRAGRDLARHNTERSIKCHNSKQESSARDICSSHRTAIANSNSNLARSQTI